MKKVLKHIKKITGVFALEWSKTIQYRTDAILWMIAETAVPLISLAIWYTVSASNQNGPTPTDVLTYYVIVLFVKIATDGWNGAFLGRAILDGTIVKDLIRPVPVIWYHIANNLLEKIFKLAIPLAIFLIVLQNFRHQFTPAIYEPMNIALFTISLLLAITLGFLIDIVIGLGAFWIEDIFQIRRYKVMFESIATGLLIPLSFMPTSVQTFFSWLPFRYIISAPIEILMAQTVNLNALLLILIQLGWITPLVFAYYILWKMGLKRYAVPGQ